MRIFGAATAIFVSCFGYSQYSTGFEAIEGYYGNAGGVLAPGQLGWYTPVEGSAPATIHTYLNNLFGLQRIDGSGDQFLACLSNTAYEQVVSRLQRDLTFDGRSWTLTYVWNAQYVGELPASDNLGSVSLQPSTTAHQFQTLYRWMDLTNPTKISAEYGVADAVGLAPGEAISTFVSPGPEWRNLPANRWYRQSTTWSFDTGQITEVSIQDLSAGGQKTTFNPTDWYLSGGLRNGWGRPLPTSLRFFAGGSTSGNLMAFDALSIAPHTSPETLAPVSEQVLFGTINSGGNLASWAADDNNPRKSCKLFVPAMPVPFVKINLSFVSTHALPSAITLRVKIHSFTPGAQTLDIRLQNKNNPSEFVPTTVMNLPISIGGVYDGVAVGPLSRYIDNFGNIRGQLGIWQRGPSTSLFPCTSFEFANLIVTG